MADTTITALTAETTFAADDYIPFDDTSAGATRKCIPLALSAGIIALATAITSGWHASQDHVLYDDNGVTKKSTLPALTGGLFSTATAIDTGYHATEDHVLYSDNGVASKITVPNLMEALFILTSTALTGAGVAGGDQLLIGDGTAGAAVPKYITVTELTSAIALLGFTLADIPSYADQAAAATALSGTGRLFRFDTTGALGVTIT